MRTSVLWVGGNSFIPSLKIDRNSTIITKLGKHFLKADFYVRGCAGQGKYKNQEDLYLVMSLQPGGHTI